MEDLPFIDRSNNAPSSRDKFCISTGRMQPIDRQSEAKNIICQRLGIGKSDSPLGKKFSSVFPMGTSLDEIHDFRTFIYEYILPQPDMDLDARDSFVNNQLIPAQRQFNQEYSCDIIVGIEGIDLFRAQHDQLVQIDLERYSASLQKAKERCRERFRRDILYRMKDDIRNARRQFRELSRIMQELRYGEEMYQFQVRESQDSENGRLYSLIMSDQNEQLTQEDSLFNMAAMGDQAYEAQIDEFVERILSAAKDAAQARQNGKRADKQMIQLVDYRQYLDYDIIITNTKTGETVPLSKVSQDSSGGENQAPCIIE